MQTAREAKGEPAKPIFFLRRDEVMRRTGLGRSTLYQMMARGDFPRPIQISPGLSGWPESEILAWQTERIARRDKEARQKGGDVFRPGAPKGYTAGRRR